MNTDQNQKNNVRDSIVKIFPDAEMIDPFRIKFTLNNGIEKDGAIHTEVIMRKVKNGDILAIQNDQRLNEISQHTFDLKGGNIIKMMSSMSPMIKMYALIFSRVIEKVGDISKDNIKRSLFEDELLNEDFNDLIDTYELFNGGKNADKKLEAGKNLLREMTKDQ